MTAQRANDIASGIGYVLIGLSFIVGFLALVDAVAGVGIWNELAAKWESLPHLLRLVLICAALGSIILALLTFWCVCFADSNHREDR